MSSSRHSVVYKGYSIETRAFGTTPKKIASYRLIVENAPLIPPFMQVLPGDYANEEAAHHAAELQARRVVDQLVEPSRVGGDP